MHFTILASVTVLVVVLATTIRIRRKPREQGLPPGPSPLPLVGNVHQVDPAYPWLTFTQWKPVYGDIVYCKILGRDIVVINSRGVAQELLEKRSQNYSDRMSMPNMIEPYGLTFDTAALNRDDSSWRGHRRVFQQTLRPEIITAYWPTQLRCASTLLQNMRITPEAWWRNIRTFSAAVVMGAMYDHELPAEPTEDLIFRTVVEGADLIFFITSAGMIALLTALPILKYVPTWFPGGRWVNAANSLRAMNAMIDTPYDVLQKRIATGEAGPCVVAAALAKFQHTTKLDDAERLIKHACGSAYVAGEETTGSILIVFTLAMVLHPHVQKLAQEEIERVVGTGRLPDFDDRSELPYLEAVVRETLRWRPVVPLGTCLMRQIVHRSTCARLTEPVAAPHVATNEDIYEGYHIPQGAVIMPNVWAMAHDPEVYPSPDTFEPKRFLDADGQLTKDTCEFVFGFGRRICPGRHFAQASVWIAVAQILSAFTIERANDASGEPIEPAPEWAQGLSSYPKPFPCNFVPRRK